MRFYFYNFLPKRRGLLVSLKQEGNETATNCSQLKLLMPDGKMRLTDVANTEQILRLIQSVPSKKAEPSHKIH